MEQDYRNRELMKKIQEAGEEPQEMTDA